MNRSWVGLGIFLIIAGFIISAASWFISTGNQMVQRQEGIKAAWSQVENVCQRRMDLIPNLVNTVKGYASHEKETLEAVTMARNQAAGAAQAFAGKGGPTDTGSLQKFQAAQEGLGSALGRLMVVVEKYPDLKANEGFRDLQSQLEGTENRIAVERKRFNEATQDFNTFIQMFPQSFIASMKGFTTKPYFAAATGANVAPQVKF